MAKRKSDALNTSLGTGTKARNSKDVSVSQSGRKIKRSKTLVEDVNELSCNAFSQQYFSSTLQQYESHSNKSHVKLVFAEDLTAQMLDQCFDLIEDTSRNDYESSSWGWHPTTKRREMKAKEMRYLLVHSHSSDDADGAFEGFLSFMVTHDSTPVVPVLYIYEIHLTQEARGRGLGQFLIAAAESFAQKICLAKVMLTCFLSNTNALSFYETLGFGPDESSPGDRNIRTKVVKADYVIMSKPVVPAASSRIASLDDCPKTVPNCD